MQAVEEDADWELKSVVDDTTVAVVKARDILIALSNQAWESGDPGVMFFDAINKDNMTPYLGDIEATNPCGEVPLLPYEDCCLASLNLTKFLDSNNEINWEFFEYAIRLSIRFLDDVQEISFTGIKEVDETSKKLRRVGLGIFGWADLLAELNLSYASESATNLANYISWFISFFAWQESIELAKERGPFPAYDSELVNLNVVEKVLNSKYTPYKFNMDEIRTTGVRNVSVTSIAPTGSIALLAGCNSAIEPYFGLAYKRYITEGVGNIATDAVIEINPILFRKLKEAGLTDEAIEKIKKIVVKTGSVQGISEIPDSIRVAFMTSNEIDWLAHIKIQSAFQEFVTNSVSKTINCREDTTPEEVFDMYRYMWKYKLKGGTIYRNNSKSFQILNLGT